MSAERATDPLFLSRTVEASVRVGLIALLVVWCYEIVHPFIVPVMWAIIIAIGVSPLFVRLVALFKGRRRAAAVAVVGLVFMCLLVPAVLLSGSLVEGVRHLVLAFEHGRVEIPPPPAGLDQVALVGPDLADAWRDASSNLTQTLERFAPQLKEGLKWLVGVAAGAGIGLLHFVLAIGIAGLLLAHAEAAQRSTYDFARRVAGDRGVEFTRLSEATIRSVTRGILGVALIQSILAGLGWLAAGVPAAGLWALLALLLSTVQVGIFPILIPILIYVFLNDGTLTFILLLGWSLVVGVLDHLLKPLLLGRGVDVPMAVIFVGAIGGFLSSGIIGLFVGAVVLVLGYKLFLAWLHGVPGHAGVETREQSAELVGESATSGAGPG